MKTTLLKRLFSVALLTLATATVALAGPDEKFITVDKLPPSAQKFLTAHYATVAVLSVQKDIDKDKDYEVLLKDGTQIEFDQAGKFKDLEVGAGSKLPASVAATFPAGVTAYLKDNYPDAVITSVERDGKGIKLGFLGKDLELVFDKKGNYLGADK